MKMIRKIIRTIIILVLLFVILTLQVPISFVSKKTNTNYDNVLCEAITNMDAKVVDIALLGSHDSFSDGIKYSSKPNVNESGITNNKLVNIFAKGLVVKMSKAQVVGAMDQLNAGVRYFDVRVTEIDGVYYTCHGYLSNTFDIYLKEIVDFLDEHPGEYIIFDIQHFYYDGSKSEVNEQKFNDLVEYMASIKSNNGNSIIDYIKYDSQTDLLSTLTYGFITTNKTKAGVIMLGKVDNNSKFYLRDENADYQNMNYNSIFSIWHKTNSKTQLLEDIEFETKYLNEHDFSNVLRVNQAQRTGFIMNASIIRSLGEWSLLDMAKTTNKALIKDEEVFKSHLEVMPIFMVDYATSNASEFNKLANKFIIEFNSGL